MSEETALELLTTKRGLVIPVSSRSIVKEGERYKIYLPKALNTLWEELRRKGKEIDVIVVLR